MGNCNENCSCHGHGEHQNFIEKPHLSTKIKKIIAVVSGKGGVGKSLVTSLLATQMTKKGYNTAIIDADITGPSIPKAFGIKEKPISGENGLFPVSSKKGTDIISVNLLLENETDPVIWRGPVIAGVVKQFWTDVLWGKQDIMFIDMPPGTGDVPLTVFQSIPIDGIIVVASPQELVSMIVEKAVNMANSMNIPVLGLVENMSYLKCPDCNKQIEIFGKSKIEETAKKFNIKNIDKMPIEPKIASLCDKGEIENIEEIYLENNIKNIENLIKTAKEVKNNIKIAVTYENGEIFQHFGHTENFKIYNVEDGKIISSEVVSSNGEGHESLAGMLKNLGVDILICGGIGGGAKSALASQNITVYPGANGNTDKAVEDLLSGNLDYDPETLCSHHNHEDGHTCGGHHHGEEGHSCGHHHDSENGHSCGGHGCHH